MPPNESDGDNIEFTASAIGDYIIWLSETGTDSEFTKFTENPSSAQRFQIRADKNSQLVSINALTFTDTVTITADQNHIERRNTPTITRMTIRTTQTGTKLKIRWF